MSEPSTSTPPADRGRIGRALGRWFDSADATPTASDRRAPDADRIDWLRIAPFIAMHLACFAALWTGWSWTALGVAAALYFVRMFAITGWYHRYFSHRTFRTSRWMQFVFAVIGNASVQRGPLWWAAHHRKHHRHSDQESDVHSPRQRGLLWSHMGWFLTRENFRTDLAAVKDLARYPELRVLDRFDILVPLLLAGGLFGLGEWLAAAAPGLGTSGWQLLVWGFFISTIVLYHATYTINSLAHLIGSRRYETKDDSRNNFALALITLGEGWHNNHHRYPGAVRQGFFWWEIDVTYYMLRALAACGLVWDLHGVPDKLMKPDAGRSLVPAAASAGTIDRGRVS
jgi:stearoyl-CoA desaturase (delta-9 desaturase)